MQKKEGELYKTLEICGTRFDIRYGYYTASERERWEITPVFPNFLTTPVFSKEGFPFATADQDVCAHFLPKESVSGENWCNDCAHFRLQEEIIGICSCSARKK